MSTSFVSSSPVSAVSTDRSTSPSVWTHPSGLTIVQRSLATAPVVAVQLWVGVGSAQEDDAQRGMAHVHEHLVFKGTDKRGVGVIAADIEAAGGSINAWTSLEETVYHVVLPADAGALGVDVLLDGALRTRFDEEELAKELEVIREEIRRGDDVPQRSHVEHLFSGAWGTHGYGQRVIGSIESVSSFDSAQLKAFHARWYHPQNMTLVVVGDCDREQVEQWVEASIDATPSMPFVQEEIPEPPALQPAMPVVEYRVVENARVTVAFDGPSQSHPDHPAVELLCTLLAGTNSSVLYDRLVRSDGLAISAWSDSLALQKAGLVLAGATFAPDASIHHVLRILGEELADVSGRVRADDLLRAKRSFESSHLMTEATVQGRANAYGNGALHHREPQWQKAWMERLRRVTLEDIRRVAKTYFNAKNAHIVGQLPIAMRPLEIRPSSLQDAFEEGFFKRQKKAKKRALPDAQGYELLTLHNGIELIVQKEPTLPIFSMSIGTAVGTIADSDETSGRATMMAGLLTCGNERMNTHALERALDELGCVASSNAGQQTTVFSMRALRSEQRASIELAEACWFTSDFPAAEVERAKRVRLRAIKQQEEHPAFLASRALRNAFFANHPYARSARGTTETVQSLTQEHMIEAHQRLKSPSSMVISTVGDVDVDALVDQLSSWSAVVPSTEAHDASPETPKLPTAQRVEVHHQRKQAVVYVAYPGIAHSDPDSATLSVLTAILSGQGGRLFQKLREQRSMAYSVSMGSERFDRSGIIYGRMETSPEKIEDAIEGMRAELLRLLEENLRHEDVARAKARIAGQTQVGLQLATTRAAITLRDALLGRGYRYGLDFAERVRAVSADSIRNLAERLLLPEHEVIVVARPEDV